LLRLRSAGRFGWEVVPLSGNVRNNYEIQALAARGLFLRWDQGGLARRAGVDSDEKCIYVRFFEKLYGVDRLSGEVFLLENSRPVDYNAIMVIYDLLCNSKPDASLSRQWQTLGRLAPGSNFGIKQGSLFGPAAAYFSGRAGELRDSCIRLGGFDTGKSDAGFMFNAFPFLPVILQFWDGDDEFEPRISFQFDRSTLDFICYESAWFIAGHLVEVIRADMDAAFSLGFYGR